MNESQNQLASLVSRSRWILAFESAWRALVWIATLGCLFLGLSWFGFWVFAPGWARLACWILLAFGAAYGMARLWIWPTNRAALDRLDQDPKNPNLASAARDDLAAGRDEPATRALWRLHEQRVQAALRRLKPASPRPNYAAMDPRALRVAALMFCIVAGIFAGDERWRRVSAAFRFDSAPAFAGLGRLDVWIDPPAYTGRAPIIASGNGLGGGKGASPATKISAPKGSTIVIRTSPADWARAAVSGAIAGQDEPAQKDAAPSKSRPPSAIGALKTEAVKRFVLNGDGALDYATPDGAGHFDFLATPDLPPTIEFLSQPRANARGSLSLDYRLADDYGVVDAQAVFDEPELDDGARANAPLFGAPFLQLNLGDESGGLGPGKTTKDVSDHPWAGARVRLRLKAQDGAGGMGLSEALYIYLPMRGFQNPLARAVIEQRRLLALAPEQRSRVSKGLAALMVEPAATDMPIGHYLGLRTIFTKINSAKKLDSLREAVADMWALALEIEGGDLSDLEKNLRNAAEDLRKALKDGAPPEEIARLSAQLRAAMEKMIEALAEMQKDQAGAQPQDQHGASAPPPQSSSRVLTPEKLRRMMDDLERNAKDGDRDEAQAMLDRLQDIMENLRPAKPSQNARANEMAKALGDLDKLTREQQKLRDDSYASREKSRNDKSPSGDGREPGGQGKGEGKGQGKGDAGQDLAQRQQKLRKDLNQLREKLGPDADGSLGPAGEAMDKAERNLRPGGDKRQAVEAQGKALEDLRRGAQQLAEKMRQNGDGDPSDEQAGGEEDGQDDPLGRNSGRRAGSRTPQATSPSQRAQQVLEELRKRLGQKDRPQEEIDYLERLMRRY